MIHWVDCPGISPTSPHVEIMSDWGSTESTISAITGLDMTMPGDITFDSGDSYFGGNLTAYVNNGTIPEARVDDMAVRYAFQDTR
jgi:hypothetical protein